MDDQQRGPKGIVVIVVAGSVREVKNTINRMLCVTKEELVLCTPYVTEDTIL